VRGSFGAMSETVGNLHVETPSFIERRYGALESKYVTLGEWMELSEKIRTEKMLRNASTIALPPTGRSALVIDASTGIEPIFSKEVYLQLHPEVSVDNPYLEIATHITPMDHLRMAAVLQKGVDESISKTINMTTQSTKTEIGSLYQAGWKLGLKGISIYREGSKMFQPKLLQ